MKIFNTNIKIKPNSSLPKFHFKSINSSFCLDGVKNDKILKNSYIENALYKQNEVLLRQIVPMKHPKIKILPLVQNLTQIDVCNKKLSEAVNRNKYNNEQYSNKVEKMPAKPDDNIFKENSTYSMMNDSFYDRNNESFDNSFRLFTRK